MARPESGNLKGRETATATIGRHPTTPRHECPEQPGGIDHCVPITNEADMFVGIIKRTDLISAVSTFPGLTLRVLLFAMA